MAPEHCYNNDQKGKKPIWFKSRGYGHFDAPVGASWAMAIRPELVARHMWSPLIHYLKQTKRYSPIKNKTLPKMRDIMFASHRDAAILAKYSAEIVSRLDEWYKLAGLNDVVIAYRPLSRSNYHFAKTLQDYVQSHDPVTILCFDVTGFFDNLNHKRIKAQLKWLLNVTELSVDWYKVFYFITRHHSISREDLKKDPLFSSRMKAARGRRPIATMEEVKAASILIHENLEKSGIPQGTPISASISNLYMAEFDSKLKEITKENGAFYQRYSDDIVVACSPQLADQFVKFVLKALADEGLEAKPEKMERCELSGSSRSAFQYLGYRMGYAEALIRSGSLSRQWRIVKRQIRSAERQGAARSKAGKGTKIFTRKLRLKLTHVGARNFTSYAKRSASELSSKVIKRQVKKLNKFSLKNIARLEGCIRFPV